MEADKKKNINAAFMLEYELSDDQLEQLIENKFIRAQQYHEALQNTRRVELAE